MSAIQIRKLFQAITWRELGYGFAFHQAADYMHYDSLPPWALETLEEHASDPRDPFDYVREVTFRESRNYVIKVLSSHRAYQSMGTNLDRYDIVAALPREGVEP